MRIIRKYAHAAESSNLKSDAFHHDTDTLAAVALSDRQFGSLIFRVKYNNDAGSFKRLGEEWRFEVKKRAAIEGWPESVNEERVADAALNYWLNDLCPFCGGKGVKKMEFVDVLSDDPCDHCEGTGKKSIRCQPALFNYVREMVKVLEGMTYQAAGNAMEKLASDMDL